MHRAFFGDTEEHRRDEVFAGEREDSGNFVDRTGFENRESGFDKAYDEVRGTRGMQRARERLAGAQTVEEGIDPQRRGANFLHGVAVDFVVTPVAGGRFVGLFAKNDFINQASGGGVCRGHPRNVHTGEFLLQALDQAHKIPYGEDVMSGENGKGGGGADGCVDRMIFDEAAEGFDRFGA